MLSSLSLSPKILKTYLLLHGQTLTLTTLNKLTYGQTLHVLTPHQVMDILDNKAHHFLTNSRLTQYQTLLLDSLSLTLSTCSVLNPATLLPDFSQPQTLEHSCLEILEQSTAVLVFLANSIPGPYSGHTLSPPFRPLSYLVSPLLSQKLFYCPYQTSPHPLSWVLPFSSKTTHMPHPPGRDCSMPQLSRKKLQQKRPLPQFPTNGPTGFHVTLKNK